MIWHFWNSVSPLSLSPSLYFLSLFFEIYIIYIYIYCTRQFDQKCIYANVWSLLSFFIWFLFLFFFFFWFCGFDYPAHSIRGLTVCPPNASLRSCSHLSLFSYFIHFPLTALCYVCNIIYHMFVFCFFVFFVSKISYGSTMSLMSWNRMKKKRGKSKSVPNNNYAVVALFILYFRGNFDLRSCRVQNKTKKY